jgi:hypothetical protein
VNVGVQVNVDDRQVILVWTTDSWEQYDYDTKQSPDAAIARLSNAEWFDELDAMDPDNQFNGRGAMVDSGGKIVVGNRRFTVSSRKLVFADSASQLWQQGLAVPEGFDKNITDIRCEDTSFRYRRFQPDWTFTTDVEKSIGWGAWSKLVGAWHQGDYLLFVMFHDISPAHIVQIDPLAFASGGYAEPIVGGVLTVSSITAPGDFAWETLGYTDEGFAVFRWDQNEYVRFDEGGFSIGSPFVVTDKERPHEQRHLYGRTGGWYILRQKDMTLERRAWWWK